MVQNSSLARSLPPDMAALIARLGEHIQIARKRRGLTLEEMASRMYVTRKTLSRLEKGESGVALGVLGAALWVLGLDKDLEAVGRPESDAIGLFHERQRLPQRVRKSLPPDELDF